MDKTLIPIKTRFPRWYNGLSLSRYMLLAITPPSWTNTAVVDISDLREKGWNVCYLLLYRAADTLREPTLFELVEVHPLSGKESVQQISKQKMEKGRLTR